MINFRPRRSRTAHHAATGVAATTALLALSSCGIFPGATPVASVGDGVGFDGVQSATIQLEARGTFIDPSIGGYEGAGRGSGFIINESGLAITNNHVVVGAGTIDVWRGGDTTEKLNARVLGSSECLDLAIVQLEGDGYPFLSWHEGKIATAMDVYAAGFPLGDPTFTMTRGIVSKESILGETNWASVDSVIEHDARIRGGNSGGPLVSAEGRLLGVNYAGEDQLDYNFAIHRDEVLAVLDDLIAGENVLSLGINAQAVVGEDGTGLGVWVSSVAAGSIADEAGVEAGDLLTRMQGVTLGSDGTLADYCDVLRTHGQDATLDAELYRPSDGLYYRGQFNGDQFEQVTVLGGPGGSSATGEFVTVTDDTGVVSVEVPAEWSQIDGAAFHDDQGNEWASVIASGNLDGFNSGWDWPGVHVIASQEAVANTTADQLMAKTESAIPGHGCVQEQKDSYDDGYHVGVYQYWTDCGDTGASYLIVAALSTNRDYLIHVAVQANTEADLDAIDRVLGSFYAQF